MWASRSFRPQTSSHSKFVSFVASGSGIQLNSSRKLHVAAIKTLQNTQNANAFRPLFLRSGRHARTTAGYLIVGRFDSTTSSSLPPIHSEVFSKENTLAQGKSVSTSATQTSASNSSSTPLVEESVASQVPVEAARDHVVTSVATPTSSVDTIAAAAAQTGEAQSSLVWESIPEAPPIPNAVEELVIALSANGEPTFASQGLGSWWPAGIVQQLLEYAHVGMGLPWWGAILLGTVCVRLLVFPLVVKSQRNAAKMANCMPQMQALQLKMTEARQTGNALMSAKYGQDMMLFMKEKDISPFKNLMVPLAMAPVFVSFFIGLRKMANLPVESMKEGGLFWFTDLTVADPYFLLPLLTSCTMWLTLELGTDGAQLNASQHGHLMKYFIRAVPVIMFPFTMNFPAAILCYWVSTNAVSLIQVSLMRTPAIRKKLNIEQIRKFKPDDLPLKKKPFIASVKESWQNVKISKEMEERARYNDISFKRAGRGPIPKTYKYDPTKVSSPLQAAAVQAKEKT